MNRLDQKSVWLFFFGFASQALMLVVFLGIFGLSVSGGFDEGASRGGGPSLGFLNWLWIVVPAFLVLCFVWAKLTYRFYRYELREEGFRKESGVIYKKYVTIPYDRIQNVDIDRGILSRFLGLSDLNIQTAGASASVSRYGASGGAEGRLPAVSKEVAEQLRDELIRRARQSKNQGL